MEFETWWLLGIPIFFTLGWIAARVDIRELVSESRTLPTGYFKGLNFLLNDQPDKAIDSFIEIMKLDPESVELHYALGNLFRRRGETERAIRVHQNLLARPDLPSEHKAQAQFELGQDYLKAGLLDRAEEAFNQLVVVTGVEDPFVLAVVHHSSSRMMLSAARLAPASTMIVLTVPAWCARRRFSIFIASTVASGWPGWT